VIPPMPARDFAGGRFYFRPNAAGFSGKDQATSACQEAIRARNASAAKWLCWTAGSVV
jgi:hypothetical protein